MALGCMTMTLHKLSAGTGYQYLTRQVAALDSTEKGTTHWPTTTPRRVRRQGAGSAPGWSDSVPSPLARR